MKWPGMSDTAAELPIMCIHRRHRHRTFSSLSSSSSGEGADSCCSADGHLFVTDAPGPTWVVSGISSHAKIVFSPVPVLPAVLSSSVEDECSDRDREGPLLHNLAEVPSGSVLTVSINCGCES